MNQCFNQDAHITSAVEVLQQLNNSNDPVVRLKAHLSDLILDKHILNILVTKKKDEEFRLLDVGCGQGDLIARLAIYFNKATFVGIDSNVLSIEIANSKHIRSASFYCEPLDSFGTETFDFVVCSEVYEHTSDPAMFLKSLTACISPGGYLSFSAPSGWMFRSPRVYNLLKMIISPRHFLDIHLRPEKNWQKSLPYHPAVQPSKVISQFYSHDLLLVLRQSSLWWISRGLGKVMLELAEKIYSKNSLFIWHFYQLCDSVMNLCPILRVFESRFIVLMKKHIK